MKASILAMAAAYSYTSSAPEVCCDPPSTHATKTKPTKEWLCKTLRILYYGELIPNVPEKNILAKIDRESEAFIETRRRQLENFLNKCVKVEALQESIELYEFLNLNTEQVKVYKKNFRVKIDTKLI